MNKYISLNNIQPINNSDTTALLFVKKIFFKYLNAQKNKYNDCMNNNGVYSTEDKWENYYREYIQTYNIQKKKKKRKKL